MKSIQSYSEAFASFSTFFSNITEAICKPNPEVYKDEIQRDTIFRKNKNILLFQVLMLLNSLFKVIMHPFDVTTAYQINSVILIINIIVICSICRTHFRLLQMYLFAVITISGPIKHYFNTDAVIFNWVHAYIMPLNVLYIAGIKAYLVELLIQNFFLQFFYKQRMMHIIEVVGIEEFVGKLACFTNFSLIVCSYQILSTYYEAMKAQEQVYMDRMKREELKNQKYLLLSFSHELRNLINALMGNVRLARYENLSEKLSKFIGSAEICGELLLHLVNNILDSGKAEIGELEMTPQPITMSHMLEKLWGISTELIKNKNLTGTLRVHTNLPHAVNIDSHRLTQIMMNLVSNSIKFTENGNVNVIVEWIDNQEEVASTHFEPLPFDSEDEGLFEKSLAMYAFEKNIMTFHLNDKKIYLPDETRYHQKNKGVLKIIITDTGCGISDKKIPTLFRKFSQVHDDPDTRQLGTGLGLFITKELVQKMKGEIRAFSKPGAGTVFTVCIPVDPIVETEKAIVLDRPTFLELMKEKNPRVMVVDDIKFNTMLITNLLGKLNLKTEEVAVNGLEALEKYKSSAKGDRSFDIVTMDVDMPVMDGKRSMQLIREYEQKNNLKPCLMVMVSGNCTESEIAECIEVNDREKPEKANYFLKKPAGVDDFYEVIKTKYEQVVKEDRVALIELSSIRTSSLE